MSDAILCIDQHLDRPVLVKTLKAGIDQKRLLDELAALQSIRSKHVVQIYDIISDKKGNATAIVEEYLSGDDLTAVSTPKDEKQFLRTAYPVAKGIADIHAHGIIHRDIKRQNMKFDSEGCLKIFDFGLARHDSISASTIGAIGTVGYMAPELFSATSEGKVHFTKAIDTYAFGATLLAFSLGKLPKKMRSSPPRVPCAEANFKRLTFPLPKEIAETLNDCISPSKEARPDMDGVAQRLGLYILKNQHRALLVSGTNRYVLDKDSSKVQLRVDRQGSLRIRYDGLRFMVEDVEGAVAINNIAATNGSCLPGSCVIVLGAPALGPRRTMVTVDVAHPEVGL